MKISDMQPILGIISGVFALYVDPKKNPIWRRVAISGIVAAAVFSICASYYDSRHESIIQDAKDRVYRQDIGNLKQNVGDLKLLIIQLVGVLNPAAAASNPTQSDLILEATKAKQLSVKNLPASSSSDLMIEYFPHFTSDVNPKVVNAALKQIGFSVREKQGNARISDLPTNCIWIGNKITPDEARAVALTLLAAGVSLRDIRPLQDGGGTHARTIEIGSTTNVLAMPALSVADVLSRPIPSKP